VEPNRGVLQPGVLFQGDLRRRQPTLRFSTRGVLLSRGDRGDAMDTFFLPAERGDHITRVAGWRGGRAERWPWRTPSLYIKERKILSDAACVAAAWFGLLSPSPFTTRRRSLPLVGGAGGGRRRGAALTGALRRWEAFLRVWRDLLRVTPIYRQTGACCVSRQYTAMLTLAACHDCV
jgi:hypothetical protein